MKKHADFRTAIKEQHTKRRFSERPPPVNPHAPLSKIRSPKENVEQRPPPDKRIIIIKATKAGKIISYESTRWTTSCKLGLVGVAT